LSTGSERCGFVGGEHNGKSRKGFLRQENKKEKRGERIIYGPK
jgi:hypothetical protein